MKRLFTFFLFVVAIAATSWAGSWDTNRFKMDKYYSAYSVGQSRIRFKVPIRISDNGRGHWAGCYQDTVNQSINLGGYGSFSDTYGSHLYYQLLDNEGHWGEPVTFLYYSTADRAFTEWNQTPEVVNEYGAGWALFTRTVSGQGHVSITNSYLSKTYSSMTFGCGTSGKVTYYQTPNGTWMQHAIPYDDMDAIDMEGEWEMPATEFVKMRVYSVSYIYRYNSNGRADYICRYNHCLGEFENNSDASPTLTEPFYMPVDESNNAIVGKAGVVYTSMQKPVNYRMIWDGVEEDTLYTTSDFGKLLTVETGDTARFLRLKFTTYHQQSQTVTQTQYSNSVEVRPFHKIHDFYVRGHMGTIQGFGGQTRKGCTGYVEMFWTLEHSNQPDIEPSDQFMIYRATKPDFSDAVLLDKTFPILRSVGQDTTYTFVDSTMTRWAPDTKYYYRVARALTLTAEYWQQVINGGYAAVDSLNCPVLGYSLRKDMQIIQNSNGEPWAAKIFLTDTRQWDANSRLTLIVRNITHGDSIELDVPLNNVEDPNSPYIQMTLPQLHPCTEYQFAARIDTVGCRIVPRATDVLYRTDGVTYQTGQSSVSLTGFSATQGESKTHIYLSWETDPAAVDTFKIEYRAVGQTEWHPLAAVKDVQLYEAEGLLPGTHYEFRLGAVYSCYGEEQQVPFTDPVEGWLDPYGSISGSVTMPNGMGLGGIPVTVVAKTGPTTGTTYTAVTNNDGTYICDSILYSTEAGGSQYEIQVSVASNGGYVSAASGLPAINATLRVGSPESAGNRFVAQSYFLITGRTLYENTSVPSKHVSFEMVLDSDPTRTIQLTTQTGAPVTSDNNGYFSLQVPTDIHTLRAHKDGHTFLLDGYLEATSGERDLHLNGDLNDIRFYDTTKARLFGRVAAGEQMGAFALGNDLSSNKLGENITMVLELEGDNVSWMVNNPNDPTLTEISRTIVHQAYDPQAGTDGFEHHTAMTTTQKRVTIVADVRSGEFQAELLPVRYKVVQLYANGYSTFLSPEEGTKVIDLTGCLGDSVGQFNYVYHSSPRIQLTQMRYGMPLTYFGEQYTVLRNVYDEYSLADVVQLDSQKQPHYLYGLPVFAQKTYQMRVLAQEKYYYNNDSLTSTAYTVPLKNYEVHIYNDLTPGDKSSTLTLDNQGMGKFSFESSNTTFSLTGADAVRRLEASMDYKGEHVVTSLSAYVQGSRAIEGGIMNKLGTRITVSDILRDPYGAGSSATLHTGSTYSTSYTNNDDWKIGANVSISGGVGFSMDNGVSGLGFLWSTKWEIGLTGGLNINAVWTGHEGNSYNYSYSTAEDISTGSDAFHVGSDGDVYIGNETNVGYIQGLGIQQVDSITFAYLQDEIQAGQAKELASGIDTLGREFHLVISKQVRFGAEIGSHFAYSQAYILSTLIPDLKTQRNALIHPMEADTVAQDANLQTIADRKKAWEYRSLVSTDDPTFGREGTYKIIQLTNAELAKAFVDEVDEFNQTIASWEYAIKTNEALKRNIAYKGRVYDTFSVEGGATRSTSETCTMSHGYSYYTASPTNIVTGSLGGGGKRSSTRGPKDKDVTVEATDTNERGNGKQTVSKGPGFNISLSISPYSKAVNTSNSSSNNETRTSTRTVSYKIAAGTYGFTNQTVYAVTDSAWKATDADLRNNAFNLQNEYSDHSTLSKQNQYLGNDFVFVRNGGASCCPYEGSDMAHFFSNTEFGTRTLQIEKPTISMNTHERNNVPADQETTFTLTLANESELTHNDGPSSFILMPVEDTNPNGLIMMIDGQPLNNVHTFALDPGQRITKTLTVRRGVGYDFENIRINFRSQCDKTVKQIATFSVHYIPVATPVRLSAPNDRWTMNTLSEHDDDGYYIPVTITGYDTNYEGFHHIELQYKLSKEGDSRWVTLCSYFADDSLYQAATGTREMIRGSKIENIKFHGERDPMEQQYDLRAVSYSAYGNGYVTYESDIITGTKDTRRPALFGTPSPTSGILTYEDDIILRFSEPIAGQYLDNDNNFQVLGATNSTSIETGTSLYFPDEASFATSRASRSLRRTPFTIDLMVQTTDDAASGTLFELNNESRADLTVEFGLTTESGNTTPQLYAQVGGKRYVSAPLPVSLKGNFQRLIMEFDTAANATPVRFYENSAEVLVLPQMTTDDDESNGTQMTGNIVLGSGFRGRMMEVRLWKRLLTSTEKAQYNRVRLTGYESGLLAYYPLSEGRGNTAADVAHGNTLDLSGLSWQLPEGASLRFDRQNASDRMLLDHQYVTSTTASDYTVMFWWKRSDTAADTVALFTTGAGKGDDGSLFIGIENGALAAHGNGRMLRSASRFNDTDWHNMALTVNRSYNIANLYVDEQLVSTGTATDFPAVVGDSVLLGSCAWGTVEEGVYHAGNSYLLNGHIGCFSFWRSALPLDFIKQYATNAPTGEEIALQVYLPLQRRYLNANGIYEIRPSVYNQVCKRDTRTGQVTVTAAANNDTILRCTSGELSRAWDKIEYAPLTESIAMGKLNYSFMPKEDELQIKLTQPELQINKQQVYISVREVEDLNGNRIESTITLPVYVDLSRIRWSDYDVSAEIPQNATGSVEARIINRCGARKQYRILCEDSWLTCSVNTGHLGPKEERTIRFDISSGLMPGLYTTFAYIVDETGLYEPLVVNVTVKADQPGWTVNNGNADATNSLRAAILVAKGNGKYAYDFDTEDIVAAFVGEKCLGTAHPTVTPQGHSEVYMTLYGSDSERGAILSFRLWRANTGEILTLEDNDDPTRTYNFGDNLCIGCDKQLTLRTRATDNIQMISLNSGWNWISTYLYLGSEGTALNDAIIGGNAFSEGDKIVSVADNRYSEYHDGSWTTDGASIEALRHSQVYMIYTKTGGKVELIGNPLPDGMRKATVGGSRWCELPYLCQNTLSVKQALTAYFDIASEGDCLKSYDEFAVCTADKQWVGSLTHMRPGQGYFLYSKSRSEVSIDYVNATEQYAAPAQIAIRADQPTAMPIIARAEGLEVHEGDVLRAYVGSKLVGEARAGSDGRFFLMTHCAEGDVLRFELEGREASNTVCYSAQSITGSYEQPQLLLFDADASDTVRKVLIDQHIYIIRQGQWYTPDGKQVTEKK